MSSLILRSSIYSIFLTRISYIYFLDDTRKCMYDSCAISGVFTSFEFFHQSTFCAWAQKISSLETIIYELVLHDNMNRDQSQWAN